MEILILIAPFISFLITIFFGRFLGVFYAPIINIISLFFVSILSWIYFYKIGFCGEIINYKFCSWIYCSDFLVSWGLLFDSLSITMLVVINTISCLVHLYSLGYMEKDPHIIRFMSYLSLFTFFMLFMVLSDNFLQFFFGWEGVGLASFLLINFWYTRIQANKAALKAMIVNRISDCFLMCGLIMLFIGFKTLDFNIIFNLAHFFNVFYINFFGFTFSYLEFCCFFLFIGAMGKSAQIGLHIWLPDAMEGPTPVSALLHAATMVTAGVFLVIRCSFLFEHAPNVLIFMTIIGSLTTFISSTISLCQNDLKKVIAYSTCSQLGYMFIACSISQYEAAFFHLFTHAFFKALLFLSAGVIIHALADEQDMRKMGGLLNLLPFTYTMIVIGSLSLMGMPFLAGFYSKDFILELLYTHNTFISFFAFVIGLFSAFLTTLYSIRLLYLTFISKPNGFKQKYFFVHEGSFIMLLPLIILAFGSIFSGYFFRDIFIGFGSTFWANSIATNFENVIAIEVDFLPVIIKNIPFFSGVFFFFSFIFFFNTLFGKLFFVHYKMSFFGKEIYTFFNQKWYFDRLYSSIFVFKIVKTSYLTILKIIDKGFLSYFGPIGFSNFFSTISFKIKKLHDGYFINVIFLILSYVIIILFFYGMAVYFDFTLYFFNFFTNICFVFLFFFFNLKSIYTSNFKNLFIHFWKYFYHYLYSSFFIFLSFILIIIIIEPYFFYVIFLLSNFAGVAIKSIILIVCCISYNILSYFTLYIVTKIFPNTNIFPHIKIFPKINKFTDLKNFFIF